MKQLIEKILKAGTLLSTFGFIGSTLIQIYARFFMDSAPSWTEEASRFFFVYAMSFAAGLALKDNYYVYLDVLYAKLKSPARRLVDISVHLTTIALFMVLGIYAIQYVVLGIPEKSPSLGFPMAVAFVSMVVMSLSIVIYAVYELKSSLNKKHD
ncbi:MAG: TRAP transporter small permease subunit [Cyclobacteriaceae bacterium]